jgi:hypothetical protein
MSQYNRTMWNLLTRMVGWVYPLSGPGPLKALESESSDTTVMQNWEWMLSTAEAAAQQQDQRRAEEIRKELDTIKRVTNSLQYRRQIKEVVDQYWITLSPTMKTALEQSRLDASKRDRICRDLIRHVTDTWLTQILTQVFMPALPNNPKYVDLEAFMRADCSGFAGRWKEQVYKKNICGELAVMAFRTSHPCQDRGLTPGLASEILWSLHLSLSREISLDVKRTLEDRDFAFLAKLVSSAVGDLVAMWNTTTLASGTITERAGKLPQKWAQAKEQEEERLKEVKKTAISRYNDGPADPLWKQHQEAVKSKEQADLSMSMRALGSYQDKSFANRRDLLAGSLVFRAPKK